jgi:hypothetical protein
LVSKASWTAAIMEIFQKTKQLKTKQLRVATIANLVVHLLWYPVEEQTTIVTALDVMVVFRRPKGDRS